jgi:TonB family protein
MHLLPVTLVFAALAAQTIQSPPGRLVELGDGDVVVVRDKATVRVIRRMDATVRVINNVAQRWLLVIVDQDADGKPADGRVDLTFTFNDVEGTWPLGERWEGRATVDEYAVVGEPGPSGLGINAGSGVIQLLPGPRAARAGWQAFQDPAAAMTLTYSGSGRSSGLATQSFDQVEQMQTLVAARNAAGRQPGAPVRSAIDFRVGTSLESTSPYPPPQAPVRVGSIIRTPARIEDAQPVTPPAAQRAGVRGVVVVELTIAPDGRVTDAKVLRSIPLLDAAALETARKWRFEPTLLNGAPVAVIMTATVNFQ